MPSGNPGIPRVKKVFCKRGHALTPENRYAWGECILCTKLRNQKEEHRIKQRERFQKEKVDALTLYGPNKVMQCCWGGCSVIDPDMLTLDHIHDDGSQHKSEYGTKLGGSTLYIWARLNGYPPNILQTMCWNHQWKKRLSTNI